MSQNIVESLTHLFQKTFQTLSSLATDTQNMSRSWRIPGCYRRTLFSTKSRYCFRNDTLIYILSFY